MDANGVDSQETVFVSTHCDRRYPVPAPPLADEGGDIVVAESGADFERHRLIRDITLILCSGRSPNTPDIQNPHNNALRPQRSGARLGRPHVILGLPDFCALRVL